MREVLAAGRLLVALDALQKAQGARSDPAAGTGTPQFPSPRRSVPGRYLAKVQPGPKFPKLGFGDDRRETPITSTPTEYTNKAKIVAHQVAGQYEPEHRGPIKEAHFKVLADDVSGAVSPVGRASFALTPEMMQRPDRPWSTTEATKLHEDNHQMFNRVTEKHGDHAAKALARNLMMTVPEADRNVSMDLFQRDNPEIAKNPSDRHHYEEWMCSMIDYANDPWIRQWHANKWGWDPAQQRAVHDAVKRTLRHVNRAAKIADAQWLIRKKSFLGLSAAVGEAMKRHGSRGSNQPTTESQAADRASPTR